MNLKFWTWPEIMRRQTAFVSKLQMELGNEIAQRERLELRLSTLNSQPSTPARLMLRGLGEEELARSFSSAPDAPWFSATLEEADLLFMETVNELVNKASAMSDTELRQAVGQLRGISELRERLEHREAVARQARADGMEDKAEE